MPKATKNLQPPFVIENCVSVAYVPGRYTPPGGRLGPTGFLGLYLAHREPRFSYWTFRKNGHRLAFSAIGKTGNLEYALIWGLLHYAVPFGQWRPYAIGAAERHVLRKMRLLKQY